MNDLCPKCRGLRELRTVTEEKQGTDKDGGKQTLVIKSMFCTVCNTFFRSEEIFKLEKNIL